MIDPSVEAMTECPACGCAYANMMGALGNLVHLRCQGCGIVYSTPASYWEDDEDWESEEESDEDDDDDDESDSEEEQTDEDSTDQGR
jgi:hypothetical protein